MLVWMQTIRRGFSVAPVADVAAEAATPRARPMLSRRGSVRQTPAPRRKVRRFRVRATGTFPSGSSRQKWTQRHWKLLRPKARVVMKEGKRPEWDSNPRITDLQSVPLVHLGIRPGRGIVAG